MEHNFHIAKRAIGAGKPAFITAEIGINHNGDLKLAQAMIQAAARAGADAVKFQAFKADAFVSRRIGKASHQKAALDKQDSVFEMWKRLELSSSDFQELSDCAAQSGVLFYASAFDPFSIDMLAEIGVPAYKIASGELTNLPLVQRAAQKGLPLILSVGMASLGEIESALNTIYAAGNRDVALLHCVANYPVEVCNVHLRRISRLRKVFEVPVGYSDHTTSVWASVGAVALGASLIEKHFTLDKKMPGSDHALSANPADLETLVQGIRIVEGALGSGELVPLSVEDEGRRLFRRGLTAAGNIPAGTILTSQLVEIKRPAAGIEPAQLKTVIGRRTRRDIAEGEPITWEDV